MFLCSVASELSNCHMTVGVCLRSDTCVIYIGDVKTTGHCLILAGLKGHQV